jgi:ribonuclease HI
MPVQPTAPGDSPNPATLHNVVTWEVYVDGSWMDGRTGYGAVILGDGQLVKEGCGSIADVNTEGTRQVAGELFAVGWALRWLRDQGVREVHVYYDYLGIEKWATSQWKAKLPLTQRYQAFMKELRQQGMRVIFHKVKAHTGNLWNERADELAKAGAERANAPAATPSPATQSPQPAAPAPNPRLALLEKHARAFAKELQQAGIPAQPDKLYNQMYFRIWLGTEQDRQGRIDIYHTAKKPWNPVAAIPDPQRTTQILGAWAAYRQRLGLRA